MRVKVLCIGHDGGGDDLVDVVVDDAELAELLDLSRDIVELVEVDGQRGFVDDSLHAGHAEAVVVGVVEAGVHHPVLAEAEDLPVDQGADLPVPNGADEALALQVDGFQDPRHLVMGEAHPGAVVQDLRQLGLPPVLVQNPSARSEVRDPQQLPVLAVVHDDGCVAFRGGVDVAVVADGADRLHGVASHARHRNGRQVIQQVVIEDVLALAVQQQHHGLGKEGQNRKMNRIIDKQKIEQANCTH